MTGAPELGPWLGRLTGTRGPSARVPGLDDLRLELIAELFETAATARDLDQRGRPDEAHQTLSGTVWLELYRAVARRVAARTMDEARRRIETAAVESRMPKRLVMARMPGEEDMAIANHRAHAAGIPLERLAAEPPGGEWSDQVPRRAAALQDAWDRLEVAMGEELERWTAVARGVGAWRRDPRPLWLITAFSLAVMLWLGLAIGGYLPAPGLIGSVRDWWWSLPWP